MNLADKVIKANEEELETEVIEKKNDDGAPEGYYTDDLGLWVEQDIRKHKAKFARYILFRCRYLNHNIYIRHSTMLFSAHTLVRKTATDVAILADLPEPIPMPIAVWVYKRLFEDAPHLDPTKIEIVPGHLWDMKNCSIVSMSKTKYKTVS